MYCKYCGAETENRDGICEKCQLIKEDVEKDITVVPEEPQKRTFCKNCGYEVTNEIFCPKCKQIVEAVDFEDIDASGYKMNKILKLIVTIILGIIFTIFIVATVKQCTETQKKYNNDSYTNGGSSGSSGSSGSTGSSGGNIVQQVTSRDATVDDLIMQDDFNLETLSLVLNVTPKCDIKNLELTLTFYYEDGTEMKTVVKYLGDVKEAQAINVQIPITDFSLSEIYKMGNTRIIVSNGRVPYIQ